jgi:DNA-binding NtrC family response regulator
MPAGRAPENPVLVIEPEARLRESIRAALEAGGYDVKPVDGAHAALDYLGTGGGACMILLGVADRSEASRFRREQMRDATLAEIPVVIYSGDQSAGRDDAFAGIAHHIPAPVLLDRVSDAVSRYCLGGSAPARSASGRRSGSPAP